MVLIYEMLFYSSSLNVCDSLGLMKPSWTLETTVNANGLCGSIYFGYTTNKTKKFICNRIQTLLGSIKYINLLKPSGDFTYQQV
jgi:hypothetical protein